MAGLNVADGLVAASAAASSVPGSTSSPASSTPTSSSTAPSTTSSSPSASSSSKTTATSTPTSTSPSSTSTSTKTTIRPSTTITTSKSTIPPRTTVVTSTITSQTPGATAPTPHTTTIVITSSGSTVLHTITSTTPPNTTSSTSSPSQLANNGHHHGGGGAAGLTTGATTAIAVVIPVVVVALLLGLGICFWRRRKQKKNAAEERRKEVEDYGFNPNQDPHLPVVAAADGGTQMVEDHNSGYRGWGATTASNRKASTTLSAGHTQQLSDADNSYAVPSSPDMRYVDGVVADGMAVNHHQRNTFDSDELSALPVARSHSNNNGAGAGGMINANGVPIKRGPSNASSAYSAGGRSDHSDEPPMPNNGAHAFDYTPTQGYGYSQHGPYGDGTYGGGQDANNMPIVQDVSARRNTRIQPAGSYQQGNSGIAQNF